MPDLKGTKTYENLKRAFAEEAQNNRRYLYYAKQADLAGDVETAALFAQTAEERSNQAHGHFKHIDGLDEVQATLEAALSIEKELCETLYPDFMKMAKDEGLEEIATWFENLAKAKQAQSQRFQEALDRLKGSGDASE